MNQRSCDYATLSFDFIISTTFLNFTKVFTKNSDFAFRGSFTTQDLSFFLFTHVLPCNKKKK